MRPCTLVWLILLALTMVTFSIGEAGLGGKVIVAALLVITLLKGQMVAAYFMGLRKTSLLWRAIMGGYLLFVGSMIGIAYWISIPS